MHYWYASASILTYVPERTVFCLGVPIGKLSCVHFLISFHTFTCKMLVGVVAANVLRVMDPADTRSIGVLLVGYFFQGKPLNNVVVGFAYPNDS